MWTSLYAAAVAVAVAAAAANDVSFNCEKYSNFIINFLLFINAFCRIDEIGFFSLVGMKWLQDSYELEIVCVFEIPILV